MKTLFFLAIIFLFSILTARADMVIVRLIEGSGTTTPITIKFKADKIRSDVAPDISTLLDAETGDMTILRHAKKTYAIISAENAKAVMEKAEKFMQEQEKEADKLDASSPDATKPDAAKPETADAAPAPALIPVLASTGNMEHIGSYDTEEYVGKAGDIKVSYWVARNFRDWQAIKKQMLKIEEHSLWTKLRDRAPSVKDLPGMPIKVEVLTAEGKKYTYTVLSATEKVLDASDFVIPAGYKELKMPPQSTPTPAKNSAPAKKKALKK